MVDLVPAPRNATTVCELNLLCLGQFMESGPIEKLIARINRKDWWHVPPSDPKAYQKRGMFLASTFREAEFWGRPLDTPIRVKVVKPIIGDEITIQNELRSEEHTSELQSLRHLVC